MRIVEDQDWMELTRRSGWEKDAPPYLNISDQTWRRVLQAIRDSGLTSDKWFQSVLPPEKIIIEVDKAAWEGVKHQAAHSLPVPEHITTKLVSSASVVSAEGL